MINSVKIWINATILSQRSHRPSIMREAGSSTAVDNIVLRDRVVNVTNSQNRDQFPKSDFQQAPSNWAGPRESSEANGRVKPSAALHGLPTELVHQIAEYLPHGDRLALAGANKRLRDALAPMRDASLKVRDEEVPKQIAALLDSHDPRVATALLKEFWAVPPKLRGMVLMRLICVISSCPQSERKMLFDGALKELMDLPAEQRDKKMEWTNGPMMEALAINVSSLSSADEKVVVEIRKAIDKATSDLTNEHCRKLNREYDDVIWAGVSGRRAAVDGFLKALEDLPAEQRGKVRANLAGVIPWPGCEQSAALDDMFKALETLPPQQRNWPVQTILNDIDWGAIRVKGAADRYRALLTNPPY